MAAGYPVKANYATGDVLTATNLNDLAGTVNFAVNSTPTTGTQMAGKNAIINGDFGIWQRGTSFTPPATTTYTADRWASNFDGSGACTVSQQSFTAGTAPVAGYEGQYFIRQQVTTSGTSTYFQIQQAIEDVRTFAGQAFTVSFWAKADAARNGTLFVQQNFGSGGSTTNTVINQTFALTTSWQRFTFTATMTSVSGKTIGTSNFIHIIVRAGATAVGTQLDLWGVQVEAGSSATPFQTATGTKQGELAACQRYYWRNTAGSVYAPLSPMGIGNSTIQVKIPLQTPVTMRVVPTSVEYSNVGVYDGVNLITSPSAVGILDQTTLISYIYLNFASGITQYRAYLAMANNTTSAYLALNAEL